MSAARFGYSFFSLARRRRKDDFISGNFKSKAESTKDGLKDSCDWVVVTDTKGRWYRISKKRHTFTGLVEVRHSRKSRWTTSLRTATALTKWLTVAGLRATTTTALRTTTTLCTKNTITTASIRNTNVFFLSNRTFTASRTALTTTGIVTATGRRVFPFPLAKTTLSIVVRIARRRRWGVRSRHVCVKRELKKVWKASAHWRRNLDALKELNKRWSTP